MGDAREHLRRWREAGLLDQETSERIAAFEEGRTTAPAERSGGERLSFTEVLVYLGIAIIGAGVVVLSATNWGHLASWARICVPGIPAVAGTWAGAYMRRLEQPGLRRGGLVAWAVASGLIAGTVAVGLHEAGVGAENNAVVSGLVMAVAALMFWLIAPTEVQVVAGAAALLVLSLSASAETSRVSERWAPAAGGLAMLGFGAVAAALAELGVIRPRFICRLLAALALALGAFYASAGGAQAPWLEVLPFGAGAALVWLSVRAGFFPYAILGILAIFGGTMVTILRHVSDPTLAALALMATGVALIAAVVVLARFRPGGGERPPGTSPRPARV